MGLRSHPSTSSVNLLGQRLGAAGQQISYRAELGILGALMLVIAAGRMRNAGMPVDIDINVYQVIGHELLRGRLLYTEVWDHKPPLLHVAFAAFELITGWGAGQVLCIGITLSVLTLVGAWYAGRAFGVLGGLAAAGSWTILQADLAMQAQAPNVEAFVNAAVVWAFAMLVHGRARWIPAWLFAMATLFKPNAITFPALLGLAHVSASNERRTAVLDVSAWLTLGAGAWLATSVWFAAHGRLGDFREAVFTYNTFYSGSIPRNFLAALLPEIALNRALLGALPAMVLVGVMFVLRPPKRYRELMAGGLLASWMAILLPGHFFRHYFQLSAHVLCRSRLGSGHDTCSQRAHRDGPHRDDLRHVAGAAVSWICRKW